MASKNLKDLHRTIPGKGKAERTPPKFVSSNQTSECRLKDSGNQ